VLVDDQVRPARAILTSESPAPARMQHHAQDAVDAEPGVPETSVVHGAYFFDSQNGNGFCGPSCVSQISCSTAW
jgi:hypothetical protein